MTIPLRDYQIEALEAVVSEYSNGVTRQVLSLPTGSGKTVVMSSIAKHFNKKTLLLAHREELLTQAKDKFLLFWPEVSIGTVKAELNEMNQQVVIGSVQTCSRPRRLEELKKQNFEVLMVDECHHSLASTYQTIINELGFGEGSAKLLVGVSATIDREGLGSVFDKVTFARSVGTMIRAGFLAPIQARRIITNLTLEKIRIQNGDFAVTELSEAINLPERNRFIVQKFKEYGAELKTIAICCDVKHCHDLAAAFNEAGIKAHPVWGDMDKEARVRVLDDLKKGNIQVATSCGVLTEGYDESSISCVIMARPTKSQTLYIQSVGRGLRKHPGKENCLLLDFTDRGHSLDSIMQLNCILPEATFLLEEEGEEIEEDDESEEIDRTPKMGAVPTSDRAFDIVGASRFCWVEIGGGVWSLLDDDDREIVMTPTAEGTYTAKVFYPDGTFKVIVNRPIPLDYSAGVCEDYARRYLKVTLADRSKSWLKSDSPITNNQRSFLQKEGILVDGMSKAEAAIEIRRVIGIKNQRRRVLASEPITSKQAYFLRSQGIDPKGMTKLDGMTAIGKLKKATGVIQ